MAHFLFQPHIVGPENNITSPDVMVDTLSAVTTDSERRLPVQRLCSDYELQAEVGGHIATSAFALIACGGGPLLAPALLLSPSQQPDIVADIVIARSAWRLRNVLEQFGDIQLSASESGQTTDCALASLPTLTTLITHSEGDQLVLPRGVLKLCPAKALTVEAPSTIQVQLEDKTLQRQISLTLNLSSVDTDRWGDDRPLPRYTVGPVGEVTHYI